MKSKNKTLHHLGFIALAFTGLSSPLAQAASQTWTNSASDSLWNTTSTNWTGAVWTNNNDAVFGATGVGSIAVASDVIVNDITFSTTGYTLTGNLMLANDQASTFTVSANETISAIIANNTAGASSLTKAGGSTLTLSGANTYSGGTTLNAGTVSVGNDAAFGTGAVTIAGASTVTNSTAVTLANNFTTTALPTFTSSGGTMGLNGDITGGQGVTLNPTNKITLAGTNNVATSATGSFIGLNINAGAGGVDITGSTTVGAGLSGATNNGGVTFAGTTTVTLQSGGSLTINGSGTTASNTPNSIIGHNVANGTTTLLVNGGTLTVGANTGFIIGNNRSDTTGMLTIDSGTATINRGSVATTTTLTDTRMIMVGKDRATGTINLNGGTLATDRQFVRDGSTATGTGSGSGVANFVFNGGTLKALGTQTDWLQSAAATSAGQNQGTTGGTVNNAALALSSVTTTSANSTIDANGFSVAINNAISGAGGFNINSSTGTGTVNLGGANTYTGATTISAGRLNVISPGSIDNASAVALGAATLGGNGTLGAVTVNNAGAVISNGNANTDTLNLGSLTFTTGATLNLNKANDTFTPALAITGNLATTSGITINIPAGPVWANGDYDLISFGSGPAAGATPNLTVGSIAGLGGRQSGTLSSTGSSIILTIGGDNPVWTGVGSQTWTTAATNNNTGPNAWALKNGHTATNFWANDSVEFNDTYNLGSGDVAVSNSTVTIHGGVAPATVTFNNTTSVDYVITSDDSTGITTGALSKNGDGIVTLNTTNTYTGATVINDGTLELGDGATDGDIASSSAIAIEGTLVFNRSAGSFTYGNVISGFGYIVKNGAGTQILSGANTYQGDTVINAGTLQVGDGGTTGALGSSTITNDATLVFNRTNSVVQGTDFGFIEGTGSVTQAGSGAVTFSFGNTYSGGTNITSGSVIVGATDPLGTGSVTLAGGTLSGSTAADTALANALFAQASTTSVFFTNGKNLTLNGNLTGSGNINRTAAGAAASVFLGGDNSGFSGTFTVDANSSAATRINAATAGSQAAKWVINQSFNTRASLDFAGGTIKFGSLTGTGFFTSQGAANTIEVGNLGLSETFSGVLNQAGTGATLAVTKVGAGTWTLTGTNTYTGDTTVNAGVLAVDGDAIANANKLVINGGQVDPMGATEVVGTLYFGAAQQASGTWGVSGSGATHIDNTHFTGTGVVSVTTGPVAGYTAWADANGAAGQTKDQDHDNDGVDNGIEYFMGQTGSTFTANPAAVGDSVTWPMGATYAGVYGTDYEVQSSTDLVTWTQVPIGTGDNTVAVTAGTSVVYNMPTGGKSFVRLVVKN